MTDHVVLDSDPMFRFTLIHMMDAASFSIYWYNVNIGTLE